MKSWLTVRFLAALGVACVLGFPHDSVAQEEKETPSQKTKEAVEKFKKAPAAAVEKLEALKEAGKAKLQATLAPKPAEKKEDDSLTVPKKQSGSAEQPRFSAAGLRDPFRPLALKARTTSRPRENLSPLEKYELGQLKLVAVIWDVKDPRAMVEDSVGLGYSVKVGTPIGPNEGKVKAINPGEIVIVEIFTDFFGARKTREVTMNLPAE